MNERFRTIATRLGGRPPRRVDDPDAVRAAVALILAASSSGEEEVLFIRRAVRERDPWSGQMGLPGGRWEADDPDLFSTAVRETHEEVGIALSDAALLGELDDLHPRVRVLPSIVVRPFVFGLLERPAITQSPEVAAVRWVPLRRLVEGTAPVEIRGRTHDVEAFVIGDDVVWGMTHRIVSPFLKLLR